MSSETAASSALSKEADAEGEPETPLPSQAPLPKTSGGFGEHSGAPGGESEASELASGEVYEEALGPEAVSLQMMRPCLDGLADTLTLKIFEELDFRSLAAVKGVCRRFGRIAEDASLLLRVTLVQCDQRGPVPELKTNCTELGAIRLLDAEGERSVDKFLRILSQLVKGGAALRALYFEHRDMNFDRNAYDGKIFQALPGRLKELGVQLKSLGVATPGNYYRYKYTPAVVELVRSLPSLEHLRLMDIPRETAAQLRSGGFPNLRHLRTSLWEGCLGDLVPQLQSFILDSAWLDSSTEETLELMRKGGLLLRAVGNVTMEPGFELAENLLFAVDGFRLEGSFDSHVYQDLCYRMPEPSLDYGEIRAFLHHVAEQQKAERTKKARENEKKTTET